MNCPLVVPTESINVINSLLVLLNCLTVVNNAARLFTTFPWKQPRHKQQDGLHLPATHSSHRLFT